MNQKKQERKFLGLPVTPDEFDMIDALLVAEVRTKNVPVTKADLFRDALNTKAMQLIGKRIFEGQQQ